MNEILNDKDKITFNTEIVKRGGVVRLKVGNRAEAVNGLIICAGEDALTVLILDEKNAAVRYEKIKAGEAADWDMIYSFDMETIYGAAYSEPPSLSGELKKVEDTFGSVENGKQIHDSGTSGGGEAV